ncbi:MAG: ATP synthase subunit I [Gammaproteobacteria bacterium]|nr:ATP synthase subunit I [Gammaproteobacteria bacterium]
MRVINQKQRDAAVKTVALQALVAVSISIVALLVNGKDFALAVFFGGVISWLANAYFAAKVFRYSGARLSQQVAQSFYSGEAGKFAITVMSFAIAFKWLEVLKEPLNAGGLLVAFFIVQATAWLMPLFVDKKRIK